MFRLHHRVMLVAAAVSAVTGCSAIDRVREIGDPPALATIADPASPVNAGAPALPIPPPPEPARAVNSLWASGSRSFFHDPRASRPGDIITVNISVADAAKLSNTTSRTRTNADDANLTNFFGLETSLASALPSGATPSSLVKMGSDTSNVGAGSVDRSETINLTLAALVTQVLPNGNLVIGGHQQVRVNNELRDLQVAGIVRLEDITSANTVDLSQIAEARISYGGRGTVSDMQQPRYGSQLFDILMPW
ncbi:MAG TPA: flagellar basal body L-ring protein FlgH [Rhizomicrobium sp.]|nr:flagellar basal body L-ring protein FlgH [Rhizomicrobium sp.]